MRRIGALMVLALLTACAVGPDYKAPELRPPVAWRNSAGGAPTASEAPWWQKFNDPLLNDLEREALATNLDLEQAIARVAQAQGALVRANMALLPGGEVDASYARVRQSLNSGLGQLSRIVPGFKRDVDNALGQAQATWEIDFAGGLRRAREAANAQAAASTSAYDAGRIAISAEVADAYLSLRGAQEQATALRNLVALAQAESGFAAAHVHAGDTAAQALPRATAAVNALQAQLPALQARMEGERNRLAVLLARPPGSAMPELVDEGALPDVPDPAAGQPADILRHRPDLVASEQTLIASNASVGIAIAEYYPKISLSGLVGQVSNRMATFEDASSTQAQGAVGLRWRLFDFARIDAEVRVARGRAREADASYRQAVLRAAENVETAFAQLNAARARLELLRQQRGALADTLYSEERAAQAGEVSRESLNPIQQEVGRIDLDIVTARQDIARAAVGCERALGAPTGSGAVVTELGLR